MLTIKDPISEIISISNLQFSYHFIENTNLINYISTPKIYKIGILNSFLIGLIIGKLGLYFYKSSIGILIFNKVNIYMHKSISRRILNISLFWKLFIFLFCVFIVIDIYYYNNVISSNGNLLKIVLNMAENNIKPVVDASKSVVNVQTPVFNVSVPVEAAQTAATAFSTAAGLKAGLELAKSVPGIGAKTAVLVGTTIAAQAINITANKLLKTSSEETKQSFIPVKFSQFINLNNSKNNDKFSEYPYNLIPDLDMYINIEIWFLIILINVLVTAYLLEKKIDINKFTQNDRMRKILNYMYNRYISVWSVSRNLIIIWCILMFILCIFMSKLILYVVLSA
uniref:Uncharacterized protein n=1 Tax=Amanita muscaria TaxID=41956 RepID=A0A5Q0N258_AMAMU|nr:hypothetical protein [Amanita muscaria]QFZ98615.1 hypothetical protein [Amanita muscaria]